MRLRSQRFGSSDESPSTVRADKPDDDDPLKWERLYQQSSSVTAPLATTEDERITAPAIHEIRVITFDLDDTLWRTGATIQAANDVLAAHLEALDLQQPQRVETIMGELFRRNKVDYAPVQGEQATSPVLLTKLRKDAIAFLATEHNEYDDQQAQDLADQAFVVWKQARHDAIPLHLAQSVAESLQSLSQLMSRSGRRVILGAITDGNSDPSLVPNVGAYLDFCVTAEQVGVAKPHPAIYERAMECVKELWQAEEEASDGEWRSLLDLDSSTAGPWWVHVGDDFVKDIVAAKDFGMRSIWAKELVRRKLSPEQRPDLEANKTIKSLEEFEKEVSSQRVIQMQIGTQDYLMESLETEFADAVVDRFDQLTGIISQWHQQGLTAAETSARATAGATAPQAMGTDAMAQQELSNQGQAAPGSRGFSNVEVGSTTSELAPKQLKFCISCGQQIPFIAKFCSACGEKQVT